MRNQTSFQNLLITFAVLLSTLLFSCQTAKSSPFPMISEVMVLNGEEKSSKYYAISTDGLYVYKSTGGKRNVKNDEIAPLYNFDCSWNAPIRLSPNGLYLSGSTDYAGMGIYDIQEGKCYQPENAMQLNPVESWSPESNRFVLAQRRMIMDFPSFNPIPYPTNYPPDFRAIRNVYGHNNILWDKDTNLPIAEANDSCEGCIFPLDAGFPNLQAKTYLEIRSLDIPSLQGATTPVRERLLTFDWPTSPYFAIFDPTGEYILVAVEERTLPPAPAQDTTPQQKYDYYYDPKHIVDTVLMLVRWRTKEHVELLRFSQYGPVQGVLSDMSWSVDGSTIFVPRKNAPPLVIRLKYP